jgi:hypothetical protein
MFGTKMLARVALAAWVFSCGSTAAQEAFFTIRSSDVMERLDVRYFLTGAFGGYGGFASDAGRDETYRIPLFVDSRTDRSGETGTPAESLKAILYSAGCQFELLSVDLKAASNRTANFECRPLPTVSFSGRISLPPADARPLDIEVLYIAAWDHGFFGFQDGLVQQFKLGTAPLNGGRFRVEIPDFSKDVVTAQMQDAYLLVLVVDSGGNLVQQVLPSADLRYRGAGLKILPRYDSELDFTAR